MGSSDDVNFNEMVGEFAKKASKLIIDKRVKEAGKTGTEIQTYLEVNRTTSFY